MDEHQMAARTSHKNSVAHDRLQLLSRATNTVKHLDALSAELIRRRRGPRAGPGPQPGLRPGQRDVPGQHAKLLAPSPRNLLGPWRCGGDPAPCTAGQHRLVAGQRTWLHHAASTFRAWTRAFRPTKSAAAVVATASNLWLSFGPAWRCAGAGCGVTADTPVRSRIGPQARQERSC